MLHPFSIMSNYYNHDVTNGRTDLDDIAPLDISGQQNVFTDWLSPNQKERRQMEEQLIMEKLTPEARMEGMKRAGINPNTAAAGIAGGSATLPQPSASTNPIGDIAGAVGSVLGGVDSLAGAFNKAVKTFPEAEALRAEAKANFAKAGLDTVQAQVTAALLPYADESAFRDLQIKRINVYRTQQEYQNAKAIHEQILEDINLKIAQAQSLNNQADYFQAMHDKIVEETRWIKEDNDFWNANGYDRNNNEPHSIIATMISNGKDPSQFMESWCDYASRYATARTAAEEQEKAQASWNYRPSTAIEAVSQIGREIGTSLREFVLSHKDNMSSFFTDLASNASAKSEFNNAYKEARQDLYENYRQLNRQYNRLKNGGNTQEVARLFNAKENAKAEYESFTRNKFTELLIKQFSPE